MLGAPDKIKQLLLFKATGKRLETSEEISQAINELYGEEDDAYHEAKNEFRRGQEVTNLASEYDRHYETKAVAAQMLDGSWVGWTYWYGGGKHGDARSVEWLEYAYDVTFVEETVVVKKFKKSL